MTSNNSTALCLCDLRIDTYIYANNAVVAALHVLFAIFAVVSNAVVIVAVIKTNSLHRPANILLSSLAFGDCLVGAVAQPVLVVLHIMHILGVNCCLYNKIYNDVYLNTTPMIVFGSFFQICVMCWDRYKAVSSPMNYRATVTNRKMITITVTAWVAWLTGIMLLKVMIPESVRRILTLITLASFIIICAVSQIATLKAVRRQNAQIAAATNTDTFAREKKMAVTLRWILGSLLLSVLPLMMWNISASAGGTSNSRVHVFSSPWVKLAMCLSSSLNPVIYFWRHEGMRSAALCLIGR